MLSDDPLQVNVRDDWVTFVAARFAGALGGVVSGQAVVATSTVVLTERFPAASNASTARVWFDPQASPAKMADVPVLVPVWAPAR
jgi:hypothetical protein